MFQLAGKCAQRARNPWKESNPLRRIQEIMQNTHGAYYRFSKESLTKGGN
jgi:hypothetical protein